MADFERPNIKAMQGYTSGEQPDQQQTIKLNTNENPYPPSPEVDRALAALTGASLRRYPNPTADPLRDALADLHDLDREQIVITHGGDEALRLALTTFVEPGAGFGMAEPSYSLYPVLAAIQDARVVRVNLREDWSLPEDAAVQLNEADVQLTCIVNPHAPSGRLTSADDLRALAETLHGVLLIDEAYVDFVDPELEYSSLDLVRSCDNVLVLRTFSKGYALAGMRLGYLLGNAALIEPIVSKTRDSYNIDHVSQQVGLAAIRDQAYAQAGWRNVRDARAGLAASLGQLGLTSAPSQSNFILVEVPAPHAAESMYQALKARNILVRYFDAEGLRNKLRISIGTAQENAALVDALTDLLTE